MKMTLIALAAAALLASCGGNAQKKNADTAAQATETVDMHNAENSLDYHGLYIGIIPAADCPGIMVRLALLEDNSYYINMQYLERDSIHSDEGKYTVEGNLLSLLPSKEGDRTSYYRIEEGQVRMLDGEKQLITGPLANNYILEKQN